MTEEEVLALLKPCPFCVGGETHVGYYRMPPTMKGAGAVISVRIIHWCMKQPGVVATHIEVRGRDEQAAVRQWNTRVGPEAS